MDSQLTPPHSPNHDPDTGAKIQCLQAITRISALLGRGSLVETFPEIARNLCSALRFSQAASARLVLGENQWALAGFCQTPWTITEGIETPREGTGSIELCYSNPQPWGESGAFTHEETEMLATVARLVSGAAARHAFEQLLFDNTERRKELGGINRLVSLLHRAGPFEEILQECCEFLPQAWQWPDTTGVRIIYRDKQLTGKSFSITPHMQQVALVAAGQEIGSISVSCTHDSPQGGSPFLAEEFDLINNVAELIGGAAASRAHEELVAHNRERLKELRAINQTTRLIRQGGSVAQILQSIADMLPGSWQFSESAAARITFAGREYTSIGFAETPWIQREPFVTIDSQVGTIEVCYLREFAPADEGPFLLEERDLIVNIARLVAHFLDSVRIHPATLVKEGPAHPAAAPVVRELLVIATPFEQFCSQNRLSGELSTAEFKITRVTETARALELAAERSFDCAIIMAGIDIPAVQHCIEQLQLLRPAMGLQVLLTSRSGQTQAGQRALCPQIADALIWSTDTRLYDIIVRLFEDGREIALAQPESCPPYVLVVEDDPRFRTQLLSALCSSIGVYLPSPELDERVLGARERIRIVAVRTFETAMRQITSAPKALVGLITDVEFERYGTLFKTAGIELCQAARESNPHLPVRVLSANSQRRQLAEQAGFVFTAKDDPQAITKMVAFAQGIATLQETPLAAREELSLRDLIQQLENQVDPPAFDSCLVAGVLRWLTLRMLYPEAMQVADLGTIEDLAQIRNGLIERLCGLLRVRCAAHLVHVDDTLELNGSCTPVQSGGKPGGKGQGVAYLNWFVSRFDNSAYNDRLQLNVPCSVIIGTGEYKRFIETVELDALIKSGADYRELCAALVAIPLSAECMRTLERIIDAWDHPLAVRSSSLLEDSLTRPLAGVFDTYILPNADPDPAVRLEQLATAVRLVFASQLRPDVRALYESGPQSQRDDLMAVVIQKLVGQPHGDYFYPTISGVACTRNYYPVGIMTPEDGFAVLALGLGTYVVEGRSGQRFCPRHPGVEFGSVRDMLNASQVSFYAVNTAIARPDWTLGGEKAALELLTLTQAQSHGTLKHCASVYNSDNDTIVADLEARGPRVLNFADILKHGYIPLAELLDKVLTQLQEELGTPVEIEFAVDLKGILSPSILYLLQVRPLSGEQLGYDLESVAYRPQDVLIYSQTALGNGSIDGIQDAIVVNLENWDRLKTLEMVSEIEYFNRRLGHQSTPYLLVGPGRWGTRDKSLGVPVVWSQISHARVIVETALDNYPLDASLGSHFFHNVTAMNMGYLAVSGFDRSTIAWDSFENAHVIERLKWFRHVRFDEPLGVRIDGRQKKGVIVKGWDL